MPLRGLASIEPALGQTLITREGLQSTIDVTKNSIFLIDFIQQASSQGMSRDEAMEQAVRLRLRPVLMTTISTVVGMLPMILETAIGLERMSPLATAAGFGLLVGTVMTLVITPVTYTLLDDAAKLATRR